ncbi:MAG: hypothetical protein ABI402_04625 [Ferruginibacter sp.]
MAIVRKISGLYWILFLLSVVAFFWVYAVAGGYCSMVLPFNVTFFSLAIGIV